MLWNTTRGKLQIVLLALASTSLAYTAYLLYQYQLETNIIRTSTKDNAIAATQAAAHDIDEVIASLMPTAKKLAAELEKKKLKKSEIEQRLKKKPVEIYGLGVAFAPHAYDAETELYAPYYVERQGQNTLIDVASEYNYAAPDVYWFNEPLKHGAQFLSPYRGQTSQTVVTEYSVPFSLPGDEGKPSGVVYANQSVGHLNHILSTLYSGATGYWFIISRDGTYLAHPNASLAENQETIFQVADELGSNSLSAAGSKAIEGQSVMTQYRNEITGAPSYLFCEPIPATGWSLCQVFDLNELPFQKNDLRRALIYVIVNVLILFLLLTLLALTYAYTRARALWLASAVASTVLAAGLAAIWSVTHKYSPYAPHTEQVRSKVQLHQMTAQLEDGLEVPEEEKADETIIQRLRELTTYYAETKNIPTGLFLTDLQFPNPSQISIVGYLWQRYTDKGGLDVSRGLVMPQAIDTEIREVYRKKERGAETIIWSVEATINQQFSYRAYPFDGKNLEIEMWHQDFGRNILLIPDIDSYRLINPRSKPGISNEAYLEGWRITDSSFGYVERDRRVLFGMYNRGLFGIYQRSERSEKPALTFNVRAERRLVETLFADLLPLIVIALLLFAIFLTSEAQGVAVLATCASLFFGTVFAQVRFRTKIPPYEVVYFESFFFALYAAMLAIAIVTMLYQLRVNFWIIQYRKGLIPKLLYWPIMLVALVAITVYYLY